MRFINCIGDNDTFKGGLYTSIMPILVQKLRVINIKVYTWEMKEMAMRQ